MHQLPFTHFESISRNPVEKLFDGRLPLQAATALLFFTKENLVQEALHKLKYKGAEDIGIWLGQFLGRQLLASNRFNEVDIIVPLPLHKKKLLKRGYNQAEVIARGLQEVITKPITDSSVIKFKHTNTQTKKTRIERWQNIENVFELKNNQLKNKHILLVDDVVTTGATLEACGRSLLQAEPASISIATAAIALHI
jgi:ComF family protein